MSVEVDIFTDGACRGNPGPGGWAAILRRVGEGREDAPPQRVVSGALPATTNNRMELTAAIEGLATLRRPCAVRLTTDSQYVRLGITTWIAGWKRRDWKRKGGQPVLNQDLWQRLDHLNDHHDVRWHWVKGHSGHPQNEAADRAANAAIDAMLHAAGRGKP